MYAFRDQKLSIRSSKREALAGGNQFSLLNTENVEEIDLKAAEKEKKGLKNGKSLMVVEPEA